VHEVLSHELLVCDYLDSGNPFLPGILFQPKMGSTIYVGVYHFAQVGVTKPNAHFG
jgi:hypothetical protein